MKIALVYDRVNKWGGAERVLLLLHELFPDAPLYTSVYHSRNAKWARVFPKVITSFLQKFPFIKTRHDLYPYLMPLAFESFNFSNYDLVISVTSESAKGIITPPNVKHICYLLTPTRYLWSGYKDYFDNIYFRKVTSPFVSYLKRWDKIASNRPDVIVSISKEVQSRVKKHYGLTSAIIFPPLSELPKIKINKNRKYYLYVGRLIPYKKVDLIVKVFNENKKPLLIIGTGSEERKLRRMAENNIIFTGSVSDKNLSKYYSQAKALIMPQFEDFGIVSLEAQSFGVPVIAYGKGGSRDTIIDGKTGLFFSKQSVSSLKNAIEKFEKTRFNESDMIENTKRFSKENFKKEFKKLIKNV